MIALAVYCNRCGCFIRKARERDAVSHAMSSTDNNECGECASRRKYSYKKKEEEVVAVRAQSCAGPGWSNRPLWVYVRDKEKVIKEECIPREDQSEIIVYMFDAYAALTNAMISQVHRLVRKK